MNKRSIHPIQARFPNKRIIDIGILSFGTIIALMMLISAGHAGITASSIYDQISVREIASDGNGGYGYKLQYYVPAPIDVFWQFKTDFDSDVLLSNTELIEHRLVSKDDNIVVTENRYATAPGLRFLWQTTIIADKYRLEFELLNAEDCRHDFHYGAIQLSQADNHTKVTQTAFFDFVGASLWVSYPWYGGMKSTLTKVAKWEQKIAFRHRSDYMVSKKEYAEGGKWYNRPKVKEPQH